MARPTREFFERHFGCDLGQTRIHADRTAGDLSRSLNALAFTVGPHIVFGSGRYSPETQGGRRLLAHELAHVVQQGHGPERCTPDRPHRPDLRVSGAPPLVQRMPTGVRFSVDLPSFEARLRRAVTYLSNVRSLAERRTFVYWVVPVLSRLVGQVTYLDADGNEYEPSALSIDFPGGRSFSLSLVLDDRRLADRSRVEQGYFTAQGNSGRIGLRLRSDLANRDAQQIAEVLYHEGMHMFSYWVRSPQIGTRRLPVLPGGVSTRLGLAAYQQEITGVEERLQTVLNVVNAARRGRGTRQVSSWDPSLSPARAYARYLVEEAVVRAETDYFSTIRARGTSTVISTAPTISGAGGFLDSYLFHGENMLTAQDERAVAGDNDAQRALAGLRAALQAVQEEHLTLRLSPLYRQPFGSQTRPSLAPGFQETRER